MLTILVWDKNGTGKQGGFWVQEDDGMYTHAKETQKLLEICQDKKRRGYLSNKLNEIQGAGDQCKVLITNNSWARKE